MQPAPSADGQAEVPVRTPALVDIDTLGGSRRAQHPDELAEEVAGAGLRVVGLVGVEGLAAWVPELAQRWDDPEGKETILFSARAIESEPSLRGLSAHLMAVATPGHKHGV